MDTILVALIIAAAAVYLGRRVYRVAATARRNARGGCAGGCGCGSAEH